MPYAILLAIVLIGAAAADGSEPKPKAVVEKVLALAERQDWPAVSALLTADAQFGVKDVGGPLNLETVSVLAVPYQGGCKVRPLPDATETIEGFAGVRSVETVWDCPAKGKPGTHEIRISFMVRADKLAGFYIA